MGVHLTLAVLLDATTLTKPSPGRVIGYVRVVFWAVALIVAVEGPPTVSCWAPNETAVLVVVLAKHAVVSEAVRLMLKPPSGQPLPGLPHDTAIVVPGATATWQTGGKQHKRKHTRWRGEAARM